MTWAERTQPIKTGDTVAYSAAFLRSIGCFTGELPQARGEVTGLVQLADVTLAEIDWHNDEIPARVNVKNLVRSTERGVLE